MLSVHFIPIAGSAGHLLLRSHNPNYLLQDTLLGLVYLTCASYVQNLFEFSYNYIEFSYNYIEFRYFLFKTMSEN